MILLCPVSLLVHLTKFYENKGLVLGCFSCSDCLTCKGFFQNRRNLLLCVLFKENRIQSVVGESCTIFVEEVHSVFHCGNKALYVLHIKSNDLRELLHVVCKAHFIDIKELVRPKCWKHLGLTSFHLL